MVNIILNINIWVRISRSGGGEMRNKSMKLACELYSKLGANKELVILCVGTSKLLGDAFGPLVGSMLKYEFNIPVYVYGDLIHNITAQNLESYMRMVKKYHKNSHVLVVDSALGNDGEIGVIKTYNHGCKPRSGIDDTFDIIGNSSILGIVENKGLFKMLINAKRYFITSLARVTAEAIEYYYKLIKVLPLI